jgi:DNA-binding GntR family transcriptional regulator
MFARLADVVAEVLAGRTHHHLMPDEPSPVAVRLHAQVAEAVQCGDALRAEESMREIVTEAGVELRAMLD